jgi:succinoglycan biosynthesis protein ExoA
MPNHSLQVSVLLPVRNEAPFIAACLDSILRQDFPPENIEILVIDGDSGDDTRSIVEDYRKKHPQIRLIDNPGKIVTKGLNAGLAQANSRLIVRCDAHALYAGDYVSSCVAVSQETGAANVGGHMRALPSNGGLVANAIAIAHYSPFGLGGGRFHDLTQEEGEVETVWLGCYKKEVFEKVGTFTEALFRSEDIDMNQRLRRAGFRIFLSPRIKAWYFCRPTIGALFHQRFLDGRGVVQTLGVNAGAVRPRHLIPLAATTLSVALVVGIGLGIVLNIPWLLKTSAATLAIAGCAWVFGALWFSIAAFRQTDAINAHITNMRHTIKKSAAALLPLVFAVLHCSYGMGSLLELLKLNKR